MLRRKIALRFLVSGLYEDRRKISADCALDVEAMAAQNGNQVQQVHATATAKFQDPERLTSHLGGQELQCPKINLFVLSFEQGVNACARGSASVLCDCFGRSVFPEKRISFCP